MSDAVQVARTQHGPFTRLMLTAPDVFKPAAQSVFLVGDTLIDTGGTRVAHALVEALRDNPPRRILCTHQHEDHVGGVGALRRAFGQIPVHVARSYLPLLATFDYVPEYRARYWGTPEPIIDAIGFDPGDTFTIGNHHLTLHTLETPGHTPFHITFIARVGDDTFALTGDLYTAASPLIAFHESAADDTITSCRAVANAGPNLKMLPTHGKVRDDGAHTLHALADLIARKSDAVRTAAEQLGTRDYATVAQHVFGDGDRLSRGYTEREFTYANFVRSVFDPVRTLPATPATTA